MTWRIGPHRIRSLHNITMFRMQPLTVIYSIRIIRKFKYSRQQFRFLFHSRSTFVQRLVCMLFVVVSLHRILDRACTTHSNRQMRHRVSISTPVTCSVWTENPLAKPRTKFIEYKIRYNSGLWDKQMLMLIAATTTLVVGACADISNVVSILIYWNCVILPHSFLCHSILLSIHLLSI